MSLVGYNLSVISIYSFPYTAFSSTFLKHGAYEIDMVYKVDVFILMMLAVLPCCAVYGALINE